MALTEFVLNIPTSTPYVLHFVWIVKIITSWHGNAFRIDDILWGCHDDVIQWKHFPRYCPFVQGIHRSPVNSPHKGQWRGALMFSLICTWINGWVNNCEAGDLRRHCIHYDVIVMWKEPVMRSVDVFVVSSLIRLCRQYRRYFDMFTSCGVHVQLFIPDSNCSLTLGLYASHLVW